MKQIFVIAESEVYHKYNATRDKWTIHHNLGYRYEKYNSEDDAIKGLAKLIYDHFHPKYECKGYYEKTDHDMTFILKYKKSKNYRVISYNITSFYID